MTTLDLIYRDLHGKITRGELKSEQPLPSLRTLAGEYKTSTGTVRQSLNRLRLEGYIRSHHGKGNFVAEPPAKIKNIVLISRLEGHMFSEFTSGFSAVLADYPDYRLLLERAPTRDAHVDLLRNRIRAAVADGSVDAVFFDGLDSTRLEFLTEFVDRVELYCFHASAKSTQLRCPHVVSDYFHGGFLGIQHLQQAGCRHILVITHRARREHNQEMERFLDGCQSAAAGLGLDLQELQHQAEAADYRAVFRQYLEEHAELDGIYGFGDFRIQPLYPVLREMGRNVGRDTAVLGYYDTPWAQALEPQLSSISVCPRRIADEVCKLHFADHEPEMVRQVPPQIVVRESSKLGDGK